MPDGSAAKCYEFLLPRMFTLDREGIITHINRQAKNRFGLFNHSQYSHAAGRLEPGDLVIVADSAIGADDGNLRPADLERLGIQDRKIRSGDMFVAIGAFAARKQAGL